MKKYKETKSGSSNFVTFALWEYSNLNKLIKIMLDDDAMKKINKILERQISSYNKLNIYFTCIHNKDR